MKQRFLDTLKMIGVCVAVIALFSFLAASCEDEEDRAERETAMEDLREEIWDEGYHEGYSDASDRLLEEMLIESDLDEIIDYLNALYSIEFDESLARYGFYRNQN